MTWFYLSLLCAFLTATNAALFKIALKKNDRYVTAWLGFAAATVVFAAALFRHFPHVEDGHFWALIGILLPLELGAFFLYLKALEMSPISLTYPFLALTPIFSIGTAYLFLGERLVYTGILGVVFVTAGAYLLNAYTVKQGVLEPFRKIFGEKGVLLMILVAFIYAVTSVLGKKAMLYVGPMAFPLLYYPLFFALLSIVMIYRLARRYSVINMDAGQAALFCLISASFILMALSHFKAISLTKVSYMISVKRLSLLFAVAYGAVIFREGHIRYRFLGGTVMLIGAAVIALSQQ